MTNQLAKRHRVLLGAVLAAAPVAAHLTVPASAAPPAIQIPSGDDFSSDQAGAAGPFGFLTGISRRG